MSVWQNRLSRLAAAHQVPEGDLAVVDAQSTPGDIQAAINSVTPPLTRPKPWSSRWDFLVQHSFRASPLFQAETTDEYKSRYTPETGYQFLVTEGFDKDRVREDVTRLTFGTFGHVVVISKAGTQLLKRVSPATEFPPQYETSSIDPEPLVRPEDITTKPASTEPPKGLAKDGKFAARLDPQAADILQRIADQENLSLNDTLNLILRNYASYPKDWIEIHEQIQFAILQMELVEQLMENSQRNEELIIRLLEGGTIDAFIQDLRAKEEKAALIQRSQA